MESIKTERDMLSSLTNIFCNKYFKQKGTRSPYLLNWIRTPGFIDYYDSNHCQRIYRKRQDRSSRRSLVC